jgi:hypothetical protein
MGLHKTSTRPGRAGAEKHDELRECVQDIWANIPPEYLNKLYESITRLMSEVLENRGPDIKY